MRGTYFATLIIEYRRKWNKAYHLYERGEGRRQLIVVAVDENASEVRLGQDVLRGGIFLMTGTLFTTLLIEYRRK